MADAQVGNIVANLRVDATAWQQGLRQAEQQLAQFASQITRLTSQLNQFSTAFQQAFAQNQQGLAALPQRAQQASQSFQQFNTQVHQTNQAFTVVNQTVQQFNTHLATTTNTVNNVRQGLQQAQGAASGFGSVWQGALSVAGGLGIVTTIGGIVSGLKSLATEALQAASRMEALRAQFTALQGANQGAVTLSNLFNTAQRLGVEFGTLANAFRQFDAATRGTALEGEKARVIFEQLATGMRGMGASSEQIGRALVTFQQIISKGRVEQEELRGQLAEALPGAVQIAARAFGVTTEALNKMIEKGQDGIQFVQLFANQFATEFGGKAATATNTLTAAWQRLTNEFELLKASMLGEELTQSLRKLTDWATEFLATLRQAREEREAAMGGPVRPLPREMADIPSLRDRQRELEELRRTIREEGRNLPGVVLSDIFGGKTREQAVAEARERFAELQRLQDVAVKRMKEQWEAEGPQPGEGVIPGARQTDALRKIQADLQKQLRDIDLSAAFVSPLELAEQRLKAIEESFKRMREIVPQIGTGLRETLIPTGKPTPFDAMIEASAAKYKQDPNVIRALIEQESGFRPDVTSRAGAQGLMQIVPGTAAQYGGAGKNLFDAATNIELGTKIFADLMERFKGDLDKALTAYNAGPGRGGIPLPTGENATFAADVRRRIPRGPGDVLAQTEAQRRVAELAVEAEKPDTESAARIRATGRDFWQNWAEQQREAERELQEDRKRRQAERGELDIFGLMLSPEQEAELKQQAQAQKVRVQEFAKSLDIFGLELPPEVERQRRAEGTFDLRLRQQIEQMQLSRIERPEARMRAEMEREGVPLTPERDAQLRQITRLRQEQERLTMAVEVWRDLSFGIGSAWSQALQSVADGTKTVSEAFKAMGQSILQTMADIAAQQATQAFFKLGATLLTGALTGGVGGGVGAESAVGAGINPIMFQGGGVVHAPTLAMLGEGPSSTLPEYVMNKGQMDALMARGATSGQQSQVSIHNYPDRKSAEAGAAQQRSQGHQAIVNAILDELSIGESSRINRAMRSLQR